MNNFDYTVSPFTEQSVYISLGDGISEDYLTIIRSLMNTLNNQNLNGFIEAVPSYNNITVYYDAFQLYKKYKVTNVQEIFITQLKDLLKQAQINESLTPRVVQIPVCYDEKVGSDLAFVTAHCQLKTDEVIQLHSETQYTVHMLGFAPGFPFLSGLSPQLETPRKTTPAHSVPAGSVGIAGKQTGIYPFETPGGWQIIGRTPLPLFNLNHDSPSLLNVGDLIQFYPISLENFFAMEAEYNDHNT